MIGAVIITDGRGDYLKRMLRTLKADQRPAVFVVVDDSGDPDNWPIVERLTEPLKPIHVRHEERRGLAAAVQSGWQTVLTHHVDYVLHLEDDFTFPQRIPLVGMRKCLEAYPFLTQVVLKRQPWNAEETVAGGIIEANPKRYWDWPPDDYKFKEPGPAVTLHREIFSLNPCLIPRAIVEMGWPDGNEAEQTKRFQMTDEGTMRPDPFAFYGRKAAGPRCIHIGARRAPGWML